MTERWAHLVGSLPGESAAEAMTTAMEILGPRLRSLPDGETAERRNWVISIIEGLKDHPDLELARAGDWSDYDRIPQLKVRRGHKLYGATMDFGHVTAARASLPVFEKVKADFGRPDLAYQSGVPGDFDMAMFSLGPAGAVRHRRAFTETTLTEIRHVRALAGDDTIFQIEVPAELVLLAKAPTRTLGALAGRMAGTVTTLALASPAGTRFGVHLCVGDMNNRPFGVMGDVAPLVAFANAIVRRWPENRPLVYLHAPFSAADRPAPTEPAFYRQLEVTELPDEVDFAAGFAHEKQPVADQQAIRAVIEDRLGRTVGIAAACGLGRRTPEDGRRVLEAMAALLDD